MTDLSRPLWQMSACDLANAIRSRQVTCEDAVGAAVERMRAVNGHLNAVVDDLGDQAMAEAATALPDCRHPLGRPVVPLVYIM